ncbi:hypothetical protein [Desmospora activa]|uniref:Uncharacterized protein n=1 Tax=Desmospora activa DSM 45169 TaxID=1121389 RepID=A0A2T4Z4P9_9BACL|nr:hypothetical protein [Desmospora activa]PTM56874.1 hypothetical protein C8J48_3199 [Desmospora activa DSM 45169]
MKKQKRIPSRDPMTEVHWGAQLADLKEAEYRTNLLLGALIQCLIEKGWLTEEELKQSMEEMEREMESLFM